MQTVLQAADAQRLSCVQREAVVAVLDVRLAGHGVEVGLQGELHVVATGLHLREEIKMLQRIEPERYEVYIMTRSGLVKERLQTVQTKISSEDLSLEVEDGAILSLFKSRIIQDRPFVKTLLKVDTFP